MDEVIEIAKTIAELGIMVVCSALVVVIFWMNYKRSNSKDDKKDDKIDDIMDRIQKQNDVLVNEIIKGVVGHNISNEENESLSQIELQINDCLKRTQQKTNADRVALIRYHNGNKGMDGLSFLKMSMTNENVKIGVKPIMQEFQNYFRSFLPYWIEQLDGTGRCYIEDIENIKAIDANTYEYLKNREAKAIYGITIKNTEGYPIGFICIEYLSKDNIDKEQVEKCLMDKQIKIETLLNLKDSVN